MIMSSKIRPSKKSLEEMYEFISVRSLVTGLIRNQQLTRTYGASEVPHDEMVI